MGKVYRSLGNLGNHNRISDNGEIVDDSYHSRGAELDALEADMGMETEAGVPSYLQPDKEPDMDELNLPSAPTGQAAGRTNHQVSPNSRVLLLIHL